MAQQAYNIHLDKRLDKDFKKMEEKMRNDIFKAISELEHFSIGSKNIKKLRTPFDGYRKRTGDYRVLFKVIEHDIFIYAIRHRKDVYK